MKAPNRPLEQIVRDGFHMVDRGGRADYALDSLKIGLQAYASTPFAIHASLHLTAPSSDPKEQDDRDWNLFSAYRGHVFETVVHLQHFAELAVKEALRRDHELLVTIAEKEHVQLHDLLHGVAPSDVENLQAIEASLALARACKLLESNKLDPKYGFITTHRQFLQALNGLRNRLWHRGTFVLRYRALDELVGRHALPFIREVVALDPYSQFPNAWRPEPLSCGIDPLKEIELELAKGTWSVPKVAFLKELLRAAYANPLERIPAFEVIDDRKREVIEESVKTVGSAELGSVERVAKCPVCGMLALIVYLEHAVGADDTIEGEFTWMAKCEGCTLDLRSEYGNPSEHGLTGIEDYWWQK